MANTVFKAISSKDGRLRGFYLELCGWSHISLFTTRGYLYRTNFPYMCDGRFFSAVFCLRQKIGGVDVYNCAFQKEESVGLRFKSLPFYRGNYRFLGSIHYSRHGLCSVQIDALNSKIYPGQRKRSGSEAEANIQDDIADAPVKVSKDYYDY